MPTKNDRRYALIPIIRERSHHITVVARLAGRPARLIVDTGAGGTILVSLVDSGQPPLRWVAGADALPTAEQKARDLLAQIEAHRDLSASLTHDDALPGKRLTNGG